MKAYVHKDGQQYGPYTVEQLRQYVQQGNFTTGDHACHDGQNWVTIAEVPGFAEATQPAATPSPTTPQQDQAVQEHAVEQQPASANASNSPAKKRKIILWSSIGGIATLLVAGLLIWLLGGDEADPESNQTSAETPPVKIVEVGWVDLDDPETLDKIIAGATVGGQLQRRSKLYYAPNQQKPYTGWHVIFHSNGQTGYLTQYKEGKWDGLTTAWFENGQKMFENNFKDGKPDGLGSHWHENGQKKVEITWKDGKLITAVAWKPNGEKCPVTNLKDGNGVLVGYYENGQKDSEGNYKGGKRDIESEIADLVAMGKRRETYKDGKRDGITRSWYKNEQKKQERTYKDGKLMTAVVWKPNGEKCPETNLVNGNGVWVVYYENGKKRVEGNYKDGKIMTGFAWKPNGKKCPVTNVANGNGVQVWYDEDGTEHGRATIKDGELVRD